MALLDFSKSYATRAICLRKIGDVIFVVAKLVRVEASLLHKDVSGQLKEMRWCVVRNHHDFAKLDYSDMIPCGTMVYRAQHSVMRLITHQK